MIENSESFKEALSKIEDGFFIAQCTDKLIIERIDASYSWDSDYLYKRAFDIRVFNQKSEVHLFRSSIDKQFVMRYIESDPEQKDILNAIIDGKEKSIYYDEEQFLNIDTVATANNNEKNMVIAVGGGKYKLPIERYDDVKVIIRNYIDFEKNTGRAYVKDWRIVGFSLRGEK